MLEYDTNYKVTPPFRSENDRQALIQGILDGTIDAIVTDHNPQNVENKLVEFDYADYGINGLQTFYSAYNEFISKDISLEELIMKTAFAPRDLLGIERNHIEEGKRANLWIADPNKTWMFDKRSNLSRSENNPLFGRNLTGQCTFVINGEHHRKFE